MSLVFENIYIHICKVGYISIVAVLVKKSRRPVLKESCFVKHTRTVCPLRRQTFFSFLSRHPLIISSAYPHSNRRASLAGFYCLFHNISVGQSGWWLPTRHYFKGKTSGVRKGNLFLLALFHTQVRRCRLLHDVPAIHDLIQSHHHSQTGSSKTRGQTLRHRETVS